MTGNKGLGARSILTRSALSLSLILGAIAPAHALQKQAEDAPRRSIPEIPVKRCVNLGNMFEQPRDAKWGGRMPVAKDLEAIAAVGFDTVRLPIRWSVYADKDAPYTIEPGFFARIDKVVGWAKANRLNIIIDLHHYNEIFDDPKGHEARFVALWKQIAAHYSGEPDNVLFELLNEPHNALTNAMVEPILVRTLAEVRKTNPTRKVIVGGDNWSGISSLDSFDPPRDPNIIATFHFYEPFAFTHQGASWVDNPPPSPRAFGVGDDYSWLDRMTDATRRFQQRTGLPLFLGEYGAIDSADIKDRIQYVHAVRSHAEALSIGWCLWAYTNTFAIYTDKSWDAQMLAALGLQPDEPAKGSAK